MMQKQKSNRHERQERITEFGYGITSDVEKLSLKRKVETRVYESSPGMGLEMKR